MGQEGSCSPGDTQPLSLRVAQAAWGLHGKRGARGRLRSVAEDGHRHCHPALTCHRHPGPARVWVWLPATSPVLQCTAPPLPPPLRLQVGECTLAPCLRLGCCLWLPEVAERKGGQALVAALCGEALAVPAWPRARRSLRQAGTGHRPVWLKAAPPAHAHFSATLRCFSSKDGLLYMGLILPQPSLLLLPLPSAGYGSTSPWGETSS